MDMAYAVGLPKRFLVCGSKVLDFFVLPNFRPAGRKFGNKPRIYRSAGGSKAFALATP